MNVAEESVPLDDTGPEVDVDIDEDSALPIDPQQPDKPVLGDDGAAEAIPEPESKPEPAVAEADEHEEYSKNVKKRIDKLTAKLRESERREKAATEYAKNVQNENKQLQEQKQNVDGNYIIAEANRITAETEATKNILKKANEESDIEAQTNAQQKLAALAVEAQRVQALNQERSAKTEQIQAPQNLPKEITQQPPQYSEPDPKAQEWAEENPWFGNDRAMTMTSFVFHQDLLNEGFDPASDEYYDEINKRIRTEFPHKFDTSKDKPVSKPTQTVASATRSTKTNRKSVKLTSSQVAIAKKLGVPLEEYAKQLKITEGV